MFFSNQRHIGYSFCFFLMLLSNSAFSQKNMESTLTKATLEVYENPDKAIAMGLAVYHSPESSGENKVKALMLVSTGYSSKRNYEKSLEYAVMAKEFFGKLDKNILKVNILHRIGIQYQQLNIYDKAIEYLNKALELIEHFSEEPLPSLLGYNYAVRGFIYREQMSCAIALDYFNKSVEQYQKIADTPAGNANLSILIYNKGNCFITLSKIDSAKASFHRSMKYARKIGANSLIAFAQKGLGEVYTLQGNYNSSMEVLTKALEISKEVGDLVLNKELYSAMSNNYLALNNWNKYTLFHNKFLWALQQIENTERKTIQQSISHLFTQNSRKVTSLKSHYRILHIALLLVIFITAFILVFQLKKTRKRIKRAKKKLQDTKNTN